MSSAKDFILIDGVLCGYSVDADEAAELVIPEDLLEND